MRIYMSPRPTGLLRSYSGSRVKNANRLGAMYIRTPDYVGVRYRERKSSWQWHSIRWKNDLHSSSSYSVRSYKICNNTITHIHPLF